MALDAYLGEQLEDREFRDYFDERRLIHDLAIVIRGMREQAGSPRPSSLRA